MKTIIKDYSNLSSVEQENFISHEAANLVQRMYYEHDKKGLSVLISNLDIITGHARNCIECLDILHQKGDVFAKIYLLLEYMGRDGINEDFVSGLEELTERAHECLAQKDGVLPEGEEKIQLMDKLRAILDRNEELQ